MISILSDISLRRAGFPSELRDTVNKLWRAEDYHGAAQAIPDELLDAYVLVGTADDVAERAHAYHRAGMDVPLLQPVIQDPEHVARVLGVARVYGSEGRAGAFNPVTLPAAAAAATLESEAWPSRIRRRLGAIYEVSRPFSFTASVLPV